MSLRNTVKQLLKMSGHAFVSTIHERLNHTDWQLDTAIDQNNRLAHAQTSMLQSAIHTVELLRKLERQLDAVHLVEALRTLERQMEEVLETARQTVVETSDYGFTNPETGLLSYLYSFLPSAKALDIGAHVGDVAAGLLATGFEVFAFEPYPPSYQRLVESLGGRRNFHPFSLALGATEDTMMLHVAEDRSVNARYGDATVFSTLAPHSMPEDLSFSGSTPVPVKTLAGLHREGILPDDIALAKIDTEGYDLEVIRGMGERRYPVVCAEFWDERIPFAASGLRYTLDGLVREMKQRGYPWHVAIYRVWGANQTAFYSNHPKAIPNSWGNVLFFREFELFSQAQRWCSAVLPRTYFKPAAKG